MCSDCSPNSLAICDHTLGSYPSVVSMRRRTSAEGDLSSRKRRTDRRSSSCSSEKAKFTVLLSRRVPAPGSSGGRGPCPTPGRHGWSSGFPGQSEDTLTDDVALDLARAGVDGLRPGEHVGTLDVVED